MTPPLSTTLTASGPAGRAVLSIPNLDTQGMVVVSGAYAGLTLVVQGAFDYGPAGATWLNLPAIRADNLLAETNLVLQSDGLTNAIACADGTNRAWIVPLLPGMNALSAYAATLTAGPVSLQLRSGAFFASPPGAQALTLGGILLYQLLMQNNLLLEWLKEPTGSRPPTAASADFTSGVAKLIQ